MDHRSNGQPADAPPGGVRLSADAYVIRRLSRSGEPLKVDLEDPNFPLPQRATADGNGSSPSERETLGKLNAALLLPLAAQGRLLGLIALGPRLGDQPFSREDEQMLMGVGGQTALAIENARLIEEAIEQERRRRLIEAESEQRAKELEEARQLQLSMLPKQVPQLPHLEVAAYMKTAAEVGGDYYDFHLDDEGTLTIAVGDATGHGLRAGTMVTATKGLFNHLAHERDIIHILRQASRALKGMNLRGLYMAMTLLKVTGHHLAMSSAGMPAVLIYRAQGGEVEEVMMAGMPLGSVTSFPWRRREVALSEGDVVMVMSDGFPECFNEGGEMLGYERAKTVLREVAGRSPQEIIERFVSVGERWSGGRPLDDDVTFLVFKVRPEDAEGPHLINA